MDEHVSGPTPPLQVAPSNESQAEGWDGETGAYWRANADRYDDGVAAYQRHLLDAAAIRPADQVLDIGCGSGRTTRDAARAAPRGGALGIDLSSQLLDLARERAASEGVGNVRFLHADAQTVSLTPASFDVAISRHGTMFFGDPVAAFGTIGGGLKTGGRLALLTWQPYARQEWTSTFRSILAAGRAIPDPDPHGPNAFGLSDPERVEDVLTRAGYRDVGLESVCEPMYFGPDADDAARFISGQFAELLRGLEPGTRARAVGDLRSDMARHESERGVHYASAAWLIRATWTGEG